MKALSKTDKMVLATKKRSMILSILNASKVPVPVHELIEHPSLKEFKFTVKSLSLFLGTMMKSKIIDSVKTDYPDHPRVKVGYVDITSVKAKAKAKAVKAAKPPKTDELAKAVKVHNFGNKFRKSALGELMHNLPKTTAPNLIVDIVKSTGRIRLELGGLLIEIGVIDR
jgi:hypothetical protein